VVLEEGAPEPVRLAVDDFDTDILLVPVPDPVAVLDCVTEPDTVADTTGVFVPAIVFVSVVDPVDVLETDAERVSVADPVGVFDLGPEGVPVLEINALEELLGFTVVVYVVVDVAHILADPVRIAEVLGDSVARPELLPVADRDSAAVGEPVPEMVLEARTETDTEPDAVIVLVCVLDRVRVEYIVGVFVVAPLLVPVPHAVDVLDCLVDPVSVRLWTILGELVEDALALRVWSADLVPEPVAVPVLEDDTLRVPDPVAVEVREDVVVAVPVRVMRPVAVSRTDLEPELDPVEVFETVMDRDTDGDAVADREERAEPVVVPLELGEREDVVDPVLVLDEVPVFVVDTDAVVVLLAVAVRVRADVAVPVFDIAGVLVAAMVPAADADCFAVGVWADEARTERESAADRVDVFEAVVEKEGMI